jgi:hypothetical protein
MNDFDYGGPGDYTLDVRDDLSDHRSLMPAPGRRQVNQAQAPMEDEDAFWYQNDATANPAAFAKNVQQQVLSKLPGGNQQ